MGVVDAVITGWDFNDLMPMHLVIGYQGKVIAPANRTTDHMRLGCNGLRLGRELKYASSQSP